MVWPRRVWTKGIYSYPRDPRSHTQRCAAADRPCWVDRTNIPEGVPHKAKQPSEKQPYTALWRLQTVTKPTKLSEGDPEGGPRRLRCLSAWGGAPCPLGPRTARPPLKVYARGATRPYSCSRHTFGERGRPTLAPFYHAGRRRVDLHRGWYCVQMREQFQGPRRHESAVAATHANHASSRRGC